MKKTAVLLLSIVFGFSLLGGCASGGGSNKTETKETKSAGSGDTGSAKSSENKGEKTAAGTSGAKKAKVGTDDKLITGPLPPKGDASSIAGAYEHKAKQLPAPKGAKLENKKLAEMITELDVKSDGTYELRFGPPGRIKVTRGTVQVEDKSVILTPATVDGREVSNPTEKRSIRFELQSDGSLVSKKDLYGMKFRKKSS